MTHGITLSDMKIGTTTFGDTYTYREIMYPRQFRTVVTIGTAEAPVRLECAERGLLLLSLRHNPAVAAMVTMLADALEELGLPVHRGLKIGVKAHNTFYIAGEECFKPPVHTPLMHVVIRLPQSITVLPNTPAYPRRRAAMKLYLDSYFVVERLAPSERQTILESLQSLQAFVAGETATPHI